MIKGLTSSDNFVAISRVCKTLCYKLVANRPAFVRICSQLIASCKTAVTPNWLCLEGCIDTTWFQQNSAGSRQIITFIGSGGCPYYKHFDSLARVIESKKSYFYSAHLIIPCRTGRNPNVC
jgi:hypothetical protein